MSLNVQLNELAKRAEAQKDHLNTEAATSTALVMPFLAALGYNVFNPLEVVPEFTADIGTKKGEKVDYAIMRDNTPQILIEVKHWNVKLQDAQFSQLLRYYGVTPARIAILTNGFDYRFYADLNQPNTMDAKPFFEFSLSELRASDVAKLQSYTKDQFEVERVLDTASELRYLNGVKSSIAREMKDPSEDIIRALTADVLSGQRFTKKVHEQFYEIVKRGFTEVVNEKVQSRLTQALAKETESTEASADEEPQLPEGVVAIDGDIITTEEEVEAYEIVRALVGEILDSKRVFMRDAKSYCSVLIDDNNRQPICRLELNRTSKYVTIFDANKKPHRHALDSVHDLTRLGPDFRASASRYLPEVDQATPDADNDH